MYVCSFGVRFFLKQKQHVPLTYDSCHKHDIKNNEAQLSAVPVVIWRESGAFFKATIRMWGGGGGRTGVCDIGAVIWKEMSDQHVIKY